MAHEKTTAKKRSSKASPIKALLFDLGNTLTFLDYELLAREWGRLGDRELDAPALERAEYQGRAALDHYMMNAAGAPDSNQANRDYFRGWMNAAGIPRDEMREHARVFGELNAVEALWRDVRPGTIEVLERLKSRGFKLAIVSNSDGRAAGNARRYGLAPYFDVIIDSQVVGVEKPDPQIFRLALEGLNVAAGEALYAGDIYSIDMVGARAAGIAGKLIDRLKCYSWVEHERITHFGELHPLD